MQLAGSGRTLEQESVDWTKVPLHEDVALPLLGDDFFDLLAEFEVDDEVAQCNLRVRRDDEFSQFSSRLGDGRDFGASGLGLGILHKLPYVVGESMVPLTCGFRSDLECHGVKGVFVARAKATHEGLDVISRCSHFDPPRHTTVELSHMAD